MRKLLNTVYITNPEAYLSRDGENIVVKVDEKEIGRLPIHILDGIVCFNFVGMNAALIRLCTDNGVAVCFLDQYGAFRGRVQGKISGNVLLRRTQYRTADDEERALEIARNFITAKLVNCKRNLRRGVRDHSEKFDMAIVKHAQDKIDTAVETIKSTADADVLRGIEGETAKAYFKALDELIVQQKKDFHFTERSRRPPLDNFNALLSYAYTLLTYEMQSALETVGLDPYVGFMHTDRPGRVSLSLDMIEELRPYMADRFVLTLINRKQITGDGFVKKENGGILMSDDTKKVFLAAWQKRKQEEIEHPFLHEKVEIGLLPYVQAMLMARYLRGDIEAYPPFFSPW